jgi:hypothetical protein
MARQLWHAAGMKTTDQMPEKELRREAERAIREVRKGLAWAELRLRHLESVLRQLRLLDPKKARKSLTGKVQRAIAAPSQRG